MCDDGDLALSVLLCTKGNCRTPLNLNLLACRDSGAIRQSRSQNHVPNANLSVPTQIRINRFRQLLV